MRKLLAMTILLVCFCSSWAFADDATTNSVPQGNQGYVYGTPPPVDNSVASDTTIPAQSSPSNDDDWGIFTPIKKLDDWIRRNLW